MNKKWFTKVEALEKFMDFFNYGRGPKFIPKHNMYMPVQHTIMPRPKFRDYNKEDETG